MGNGFNIDIDEFAKLPLKQQLKAIYQNTVHLRSNISSFKEEFIKHQNSDKFNFRILKWMIVCIGILFGLGKLVGVL